MQSYLNTIGGTDVEAEAVVLVDSSGSPITTLPVSISSNVNIGSNITVSGPITVQQSNASNFLATIAGTVTAVQPNASNFLATVAGTVAATQSGTWNIGAIASNVNIADAGGSITVDGTVAATQSGTWNIGTITTFPSNSSFNQTQVLGTTIDVSTGNSGAGTQRVVLATNQPNVPVSDAGGSLTVDGTVSLSANSSFNLNQVLGTTVDVNSGTKSAGTQRVILATDQPQLTNKLLVTPDANSSFNLSQILGTTVDGNSGNKSAGTQRVVLATDQPALTNKLLVTPDSNIAFDLARVQGQASVASVAGVLDVTPRKRTGSTGLSPSYISGRINTSTTTQLTQSTCYLSSLQMSIYTQGTSWALNVTDRQAIPLPVVPNFVVSSTLGANNPITLAFDEPIICTSGINVITVGGTPGNIAYFATYWQ